MAGKSAIRAVIDRILDVAEEFRNLCVDVRVEGHRVVLTADFAGGHAATEAAPARPAAAETPRKASKPSAAVAPTGDQRDRALALLTARGAKWTTLKAIAKDVVGARAKKKAARPVIEQLVDEGVVEVNHRGAYRLKNRTGRRNIGRPKGSVNKLHAAPSADQGGLKPPARRGPGRPKGSKTKKKPTAKQLAALAKARAARAANRAKSGW